MDSETTASTQFIGTLNMMIMSDQSALSDYIFKVKYIENILAKSSSKYQTSITRQFHIFPCEMNNETILKTDMCKLKSVEN